MKCPICGAGNTKPGIRDLIYAYGGKKTVISQSGEFCDACDEGVFTTDESDQYLATVKAFREMVDTEALTPQEVRRIRRKLGLTQKAAGEIFGGGVRAFSQYERGETRQGKPLDKLLRLLDRHPELLQELEPKIAA